MYAQQHCVLRGYASAHLAALYAAAVGALPGMGPWLQPESARPLLQALGLWHPSVSAALLPVLGLLVLVRSLARADGRLHVQSCTGSSLPLPSSIENTLAQLSMLS